MLDWIFGHKSSHQGKTGIYKVEGRDLVELEQTPGNGSINSIIEHLGFDTSQVHTVFTFDSLLIENIGFKIFTKEPIFVLGKNTRFRVDLNKLTKELKRIDWEFEYSSHMVEESLNEGMERESFTFDFLSTVLELKKEVKTIYQAPKIGLYLKFEDDKLKSFTSSDWTNSASKWLKSINPQMFDNMLSEAKNFQRNEIEAMEEVNLQCEALRGIPKAFQNEFINLHKKISGNINFFNLLAAHYNLFKGEQIRLEDFKIVNNLRIDELGNNLFRVDKFTFQFNSYGVLSHSKSVTH